MSQFFYGRFLIGLAAFLVFSSNISCKAEEAIQTESFVGIISADRVNVRAGDNTTSEVLCQLDKGEEVNVVGNRDKWYRIELPQKALVYISKSNVSKKDGTGVVTEDKANVRTAATISSTVVGCLNKGVTVNILKEYLDWYEIKAPNGSYGWVSSDYVKRDGDFQIKRSATLAERLAVLNETYKAELKKPLREIELKWILQEFEKLEIEAKGAPEEEQTLLKAEEVKLKIAEIEHLKAKEEYDAKIKNISSPRPGETPIARGVISNVGKISGRLSRFKLMKDNEFLGYLTSSKVDLDRYIHCPVDVWGVKKEIKGTALFEVDAVQLIE